MPDYRAEWGTEGGFVQEYDIIIDKSYFATDARYQNGELLLLHWEGRAFEPNGRFDQPLVISEEDGNHVHLINPIGSDWNTHDDGKTATRPDKTMFHPSSIYGKMIHEITEGEVPGGELLFTRGGPRTAAIWQGIKMHLKTREIDYKGLQKVTRLFPVRIYGVEGGQPWGGAVNVTPAAAAPAPAAPATEDALAARRQALLDQARRNQEARVVADATTGNGAPEHVTKLAALAREAPSYDAFITPALQVEELLLDEKLSGEVVDDGPNGFYARHHAASV